MAARPARYLSGQYFADLLTWYHLAWTGETVRRAAGAGGPADEPGREISATPTGWSCSQLIGALVLRDIVARYRKLAESARWSCRRTPHYHPIGPLLLDFALRARSDAGGAFARGAMLLRVDARAWAGTSIARMDSHARRFGARPGGRLAGRRRRVDAVSAQLLAEHQIAWIASGERVLTNSLRKSRPASRRAACATCTAPTASSSKGIGALLLPRRRLSDLIGFEYKGWHGSGCGESFHRAAGADPRAGAGGRRAGGERDPRRRERLGVLPLQRVLFSATTCTARWRRIRRSAPPPSATSSPISAAHPRPQPRPPVAAAGGRKLGVRQPVHLDRFAEQKNRAWDLLAKAKQCYDLVTASGRLTARGNARQPRASLRSAKAPTGSGGSATTTRHDSVATFDRLFRDNLAICTSS